MQTKTPSSWKQKLIFSLAVFGAFEVAAIALPSVLHLFPPTTKSTDTSDSSTMKIMSPNGKYKALLFSEFGGGGFSLYCDTSILVTPEHIADNVAINDSKYMVFKGWCDPFANHDSSPAVTWVSDSSLQIESSINSTALSLHQFDLKKNDATNIIKIRYVFHE